MAKIKTEADLAAMRKRFADEDAGLIPKKKLTAKEQFNQQMQDQAIDRSLQALPKKPRKPKSY